jgi:uncharacterized protein (DUF305 family)
MSSLRTDAAPELDVDDDGADIVLPWWYSWWRVAAVSAAMTAGLIGIIALGFGNRSPAADSVEVGFLQDMRHHHDQAISMSLIYRDAEGTDPLVRQMADEVLLSQLQDTGVMIEILRGFGAEEENSTGVAMGWMGHEMALDQMTGMASQADLDKLVKVNGDEADRLFIKLMTAHHQGGVEMAEYAAANASNDRVRDLAEAMARGQRTEIGELATIEASLN